MKHNKQNVPLPWPSLWMLLCAVIEACLQKWLVVKILLIACALMTLVWFLMVYLVGRKESRQPRPEVPGLFGWLWRGDWITTKDRKKKKLILLLGRLSVPTAFFAFAAWKVFGNGGFDNLESLLLFGSWVVIGFAMFATEIIRDYRAERREKAAAGDPKKEKRLRQLDEWLESGLIDREEYNKRMDKEESP